MASGLSAQKEGKRVLHWQDRQRLDFFGVGRCVVHCNMQYEERGSNTLWRLLNP